MILTKASLNYDHSFIVLATVIAIVNYDRKTYIAQATGSKTNRMSQNFFPLSLTFLQNKLDSFVLSGQSNNCGYGHEPYQ